MILGKIISSLISCKEIFRICRRVLVSLYRYSEDSDISPYMRFFILKIWADKSMIYDRIMSYA